jgi:hypothetical protein
MGTNYIAPIWRMPRNANKDKLSNYSIYFSGATRVHIGLEQTTDFLPGEPTASGNIGNPKFSASIFFNFTSTISGSTRNMFGAGETGGASYWYLRKNASDNLEFRVRTDQASPFYTTVTGSTVLNADQWYHACVTWDGNNINLYLDGQPDASPVAANNFYFGGGPGTEWPSIGSYWRGGSNINTLWTGRLAQASVFNYELSSSQANNLNNGVNPMAFDAPPTFYYPIGDNSNITEQAYGGSDNFFPNISVGADSVFDFSTQDNIESPHIDMTGAMSISGWFKTTDTGYNIIYQEDGAVRSPIVSGRNWFFSTVNNVLRFAQFYDSGGSNVLNTSGVTVNDGDWHHGVFVWDGTTGTDSMKTFVDGVLRAKLTAAKTDRSNDDITGMIGGSNSTYDMNGELSNIQIWDTNLTYGTASSLGDTAGGQVAQLYNNGQPLMTGTQPQESNLRAWYKLNQSANWDLFGQSKWTVPDSSSPYTKSFSLDSANSPADYFNTNIGPRGMTTNVGTYSCWINLNSIAGTQVFMDVAGFASREFLNLKIRNNNALQMEMRSWSTQMLWDSVTTTPFEVGKWYHVVAVGDGTNIKMYINGDEITTYIASGSYRWWSNFNTSIAHNGGNRIYLGAGIYPTRHSPLNGRISNAQIWNTNLSSSQIETLYNNGKPLQGTQPAQTNLLAWYKLNQDSTWTNYNYWNNILVNKWSSKNSAITTTPPAESFGFSGVAQDGDYEGWEVTNKSISGSLLFSFWYKTTGDTVFTWTFDNDGSGNTNAGKARMQGNGYIYFFSPNASNYFYRANTNIGDYNWHNLIIYIPNGSPTYDANDINLWLDGVELGKPTIVGSTTWDAFTEIKGMNRNSTSANNGTGTQWSNWALFENVTPSDSVINTIFNGGTPSDISSLNPSIWYKLDNTDTTFATTGSKATALSITDSSSNNNNATGPYDYDAAVNSRPVIISGDVQNAIAGYYMDGSELENFSVSTLNGKSAGMNTTNLVQSNLTRTQPFSSYSVYFDGAGDTFDIPDATVLKPQNITVSMWINGGAQTGNYRYPLAKYYTGGGPAYGFTTSSTTDKIGFIIRKGNDTGWVTTALTSVMDDTWHHIVGTFNGTTVSLYVDGVLTSGVAAGATGITYGSGDLTIGALQASSLEYAGNMSNVAIWDSSLNQDDIINIYNNGVPQDLSNFRITPIAWYPMDQSYTYFNGSVLVARDAISGNDGTGANVIQENIVGNAPGSEASGTGNNLAIADLKGNMYNSDKNAYSINMADYADGVTNPANSGRSTDTP